MNQKHFERYRICGSHTEALNFIEKLEEQGSEYTIILGTHFSLGDWVKIEFDNYDPGWEFKTEEEKKAYKTKVVKLKEESPLLRKFRSFIDRKAE